MQYLVFLLLSFSPPASAGIDEFFDGLVNSVSPSAGCRIGSARAAAYARFPKGTDRAVIIVTAPDKSTKRYEAKIQNEEIARSVCLHGEVGLHLVQIYGLRSGNAFLVSKYQRMLYPATIQQHIVALDSEVKILRTAFGVAATARTQSEAAHNLLEWVEQNIFYDQDTFEGSAQRQNDSPEKLIPNLIEDLKDKKSRPQDALSVLENRTGICSGQANLSVALLVALGIPAKYISGQSSQGLHAWIKLFLRGRWHYADPTWGIGISEQPIHDGTD